MLHHLFSLTQALFANFALLSSPVLTVNETLVNLRIEGPTSTIFEGLVLTRGHNVTTPSGGTHPCDGTNGGANPFPGPTCTSALDDASRFLFPFDGTFDTEFDDFFITTIDNVSETTTEFWGILLNFQLIPVGGCQQEVKFNDDILFAFDAFDKDHFLKLTGPKTARVGKPVNLTVTDGQDGSPIAGADVNGDTSDVNGNVSVTFRQPGPKEVKATKSNSIRSNQLKILVI